MKGRLSPSPASRTKPLMSAASAVDTQEARAGGSRKAAKGARSGRWNRLKDQRSPVDPKPPPPRLEAPSCPVSVSSARVTGANTTCAILSPGSITCSSPEWLIRITPYFTAVVGVDRSGGVEHRQSALEGEAAARPHLSFEAGGDFQAQAGRNEGALSRGEAERLAEVGAQIHAGAAGGFVFRQGVVGPALDPD